MRSYPKCISPAFLVPPSGPMSTPAPTLLVRVGEMGVSR
jgi:hypothetical protein